MKREKMDEWSREKLREDSSKIKYPLSDKFHFYFGKY